MNYSRKPSLRFFTDAWKYTIANNKDACIKRVDVRVGEMEREYQHLLSATTTPPAVQKVLVVGCGQFPWHVYYWNTKAPSVVGIDLERPLLGSTDARGWWHLATRAPISRFAKTAGKEILGINRTQRLALSKRLGHPAAVADVRLMNATKLDFPDESFDLVVSSDVLEHIDDIDCFFRESARVLRPDGWAIHRTNHFLNYNALHDNRLIYDLPLALAWKHLRVPNTTINMDAWVNRLRIQDILSSASRHFAIKRLHGDSVQSPLFEHGRILWEKEYQSQYPASEFLTDKYIIIAQKTKSN